MKKKIMSSQKIEDLRIINNFSKISVSDACRFYHVNQSNLKKGYVNDDIVHKIRRYLESKFAELFIIESDINE